LEIDADVSEATLGKVRIGQAADVQLDAIGDRRFRAEVRRIVPTVDRSKATVLVKVALLERDERVLPDMTAKVAFLQRAVAAEENQAVTVVPAAAILQRDGMTLGYVVKDGRARLTKISTGGRVGQAVEVAGLDVGERLVVQPLAGIADGDLIETQTR
jgi:multidrug efflux pump subunit AcrA (membrane-fusion protein)